MKKLKIFLADLTHQNKVTVSENIPSNIGLLAAYALKRFGDAVEFRLFKYPDRFIEALKEEKPDILGVSNYVWNVNLSEWACARAKERYPDILTIKGGWTFPLDAEERRRFLLSNPATDIYLIHESEISFSEVVGRCLEGRRQSIFTDPIPGTAFLVERQGNPRLVVGEGKLRVENLDEIPSPFVTGLLDEFFDGNLFPVIETTRGCPFECNYCNSAEAYYNRVRRFSIDYISEELDYIARKVKKSGGGILIIADTNFGMYRQDKPVAEKLARLREEINWPSSIILTTGKKKIERVFETIEPLKEVMVPSMAAQSMDLETLAAVKRSNMAEATYEKLAKDAKERDLALFAELILSMPKETLASFWDGTKRLLGMGVNKLIIYTLQLNYGTVYRVRDYVEEHGYVGKYRMIPNAYGVYDGHKVFDMEMVGVANNYIRFEDYLECRKIALIVELMFNNDCFGEVLKFWKECGQEIPGYLDAIRDNLHNAPQSMLNIVDSFVHDTKAELFDSEEALYAHFSQEEIFQQLSDGRIGGNVIYKHKALMYSEQSDALVSYVIASVERALAAVADFKFGDEHRAMLRSLESYLRVKYHRLLDDTAIEAVPTFAGDYDIWGWYDSQSDRPLSHYKRPVSYRMDYSAQQQKMIHEMFAIYGNSLVGKVKIISKVMKLQNLLRYPQPS